MIIVNSCTSIICTKDELTSLYSKKYAEEVEESLSVVGDCCQLDLDENMIHGEYCSNQAVIIRIQ